MRSANRSLAIYINRSTVGDNAMRSANRSLAIYINRSTVGEAVALCSRPQTSAFQRTALWHLYKTLCA